VRYNSFRTAITASDVGTLRIKGYTFPAERGTATLGGDMPAWSHVLVSTARFPDAELEIRSKDPAALRAIASRLFHEAAKLEAMQTGDD
jgi:hypothetical protein